MSRSHTVAFDAYVVDTLLPDLTGHDRQPSAFLVWLFLARHAHDTPDRRVTIALQDIAEGTGLAKRTVQGAITHLRRRRLLAVTRDTPTSVPHYVPLSPWRRSP
ncbi:MAG: helix-turn-helix domain-containing protein [Gemmatimonadaceae bacterium]|nr:helix-turn-helix domain-containing protein [Gemmatimonadaceae bacterium]